MLTPLYLDTIFAHRNREYGAFELRSHYSRRLMISLGLTLLGVTLLCAGAAWSRQSNPSPARLVIQEVTLQALPDQTPPPPPPPKSASSTQTQVVKYTTPIIVESPQDPPPTQTEIRGSEIGTFNRSGDTCQVAPLPGVSPGPDLGTTPVEPEVFESVEVEAEFPGGLQKWRQYLERHLSMPEEAPEGIYPAMVQFIVDQQGAISQVVALTSHGYGMEEEAMRVIRKGPKWSPAVQNGHPVKAYRKQLITFQVTENGN